MPESMVATMMPFPVMPCASSGSTRMFALLMRYAFGFADAKPGRLSAPMA